MQKEKEEEFVCSKTVNGRKRERERGHVSY